MSVAITQAHDDAGYVTPDERVSNLHITKKEFAGAVGLSHDAIVRKERLHSVVTQQRLRQVTEVLLRIEPWAGSLGAAWSWYRSYPISPLGGLTAEELVARGRADDLRTYLTHIAEGGYA